MYYLDVTGEIHKAIDGFRSWESLEPNAFPPHNSLGVAYADIGSYEKAGDETRLAIAAAPNFLVPYANMSVILEAEGQYDQAAAMMRQAEERKLQGAGLHTSLYEFAMLRSDRAGLEREQAWMAQNADDPLVRPDPSQVRFIRRPSHQSATARDARGKHGAGIDAITALIR
jgi:tetratricopeptide (TPR) repeat protein